MVIDTSVCIRALVRRDKWAREVVRAAAQGQFTWLLSDACLKELAREYVEVMLDAAARLVSSADELHEFVNALAGANITLLRAIRRSVPVEVVAGGRGPFIVEDASDDKFILCAIDGDADFLVTTDGSHILAFFKSLPQPLLNSAGTPIHAMSPFQFVRQVLAGRPLRA